MKYQQCQRCIMDNKTDRTIRFDKNGFCNYCSDILKRKPTEYYPNSEGDAILKKTIQEIKEECKNDKYDCIVGVSGGIDSSYILYKGYQYGLRMLAIHIDDGLDNPVAVENIKKLVTKTNTDIINITPDRTEYADLLHSLMKASVSNLAIVQDNLIVKALQDYVDKHDIKWSLDGANFAHESILERDNHINPFDKKYIKGIQKKYGTVKIKKLKFMSMHERYIGRHSHRKAKHFRPLNYMDYNVSKAIKELEEFCDFQYYGGKHYESILTRFMQCYYLPEKFGIDKRKSHYSSLIMSNQMTRQEALDEMRKPLYNDIETLENDKQFLADYMGITMEEFQRCLDLPPKEETEYTHSLLNELAPVARKFRKILE